MKRQVWFAALAGAGVGVAAWGQCQEGWSEVFTPAFMRGGWEASATLFDDGSGSRLVVSDLVRRGDSTHGLQVWDGATWTTLADAGFDLGNVGLVHADNRGGAPRLFATLNDPWSGDVADVLVLEGGEWRSTSFPVQFGFNFATSLLVDPDSGDMYLGGLFRNDWGSTKVYRWDGVGWTALDQDRSGASVADLVWFDDGSGRSLYAAVRDRIDDVPAAGVAKWDGDAWSEVGGGCPAYWPSLEVFDDGTGPALWALDSDGALLAKWDGVEWTSYTLESALGFTWRLTSVTLGGSPELVWTDSGSESVLWRWDGLDGEQLGRTVGGGGIWDLVADPVGAIGGGVVAVGNFVLAGSAPAACVAAFDGSQWTALGTEDTGNGAWEAREIEYVGDEGGPLLGRRVYVSALAAGGVPTGGVATWVGSAWESIGAGAGTVYAFAFGSLGAEPRVFAAGGLWPAGANAGAIMEWDGQSWGTLADGIDGTVLALEAGELGGVSTLFVAGDFDTVDGRTMNNVAAVQHSGWIALGDGLPSEGPSSVHVEALALHDDGSGEMLYAGGWFRDLKPSLANGVVRWNGAAWERVGAPLDGSAATVFAMCTADLGDGPKLYAGGSFADLKNIAVWDGGGWNTVGAGLAARVLALSAVQTAEGPRLAATLDLTIGEPQERVHLWDGQAWAPFGAESDNDVLGLAQASHEDGAVYLVGGFTEVGGVPSEGIARWGCEGCAADFNGDGMADTRDFIAYLNAWVAGDDRADFDANGIVDTRDFIAFLNAWSAGC